MQTINAISLFTGSGQLDIGFDAALRHFGYDVRTILYCEANEAAVEVIKARIRDGLLPDAPIWPDVRTLPAARLRGIVGAVVGGFPCQDLSVAGKQSGLGIGTRSGLFFEMRRVALECGASILGFENVPGIGSAECAFPDGSIGPAALVVAEALAEVGYLHRWLHLAAEDIGATHGRERWWCIASMENPEHTGSPCGRPATSSNGSADSARG